MTMARESDRYPGLMLLRIRLDEERRAIRRYDLDQQIDCYHAAKDAVRAMLRGAILHVDGMTAGNGTLIDWRKQKCGAVVLENATATEMAVALIEARGSWRLREAIDRTNADEFGLYVGEAQ